MGTTPDYPDTQITGQKLDTHGIYTWKACKMFFVEDRAGLQLDLKPQMLSFKSMSILAELQAQTPQSKAHEISCLST